MRSSTLATSKVRTLCPQPKLGSKTPKRAKIPDCLPICAGDGGVIYSGASLTNGYGMQYRENFVHHSLEVPGLHGRGGIYLCVSPCLLHPLSVPLVTFCSGLELVAAYLLAAQR